MAPKLSVFEIELVEAIEEGVAVRYPRGSNEVPQVSIRAEILQRILMSLPVSIDGVSRNIRVLGSGIKVHNAHIVGELWLDNGCFANGDPLPRLSLEDCYIPCMISMLSCRIRRLCLRNSQLSYLRANDAIIGSQLDVEGVRSCGTVKGAQGQGCCRISLRGAHIEDGIEARNAKLVCTPARGHFIQYEERSRYALDLAGITAGGDLRLFPRFSAIGGVNLSGANIDGSVQMHGAHVTKEEVFSLDLDGARISGKLAICARRLEKGHIEPFSATGTIDLSGVTVGNTLNMRGAKVDGDIQADYLRVGSNALFCGADGCESGVETIERFHCSGSIQLNGAKIDGSVDFSGASVLGPISASTATIGGDLLATRHVHMDNANRTERFELSQLLLLDGARIQSDLNLDCAVLDAGLQAKGLHVAGFCQMRSQPSPSNEVFLCGDTLTIANSEIGLDFDMSGAQLLGEMDARNVVVNGNFRLRMAHKSNSAPHERPFSAKRRVNISGTKINGDLDIYFAELHEGLRARGVSVSSALSIRLTDAGQKANEYNIDFTNASANVVVDGPGDGSGYGSKFLLALEGFTYGRFVVSQDPGSSTSPYSKEPLNRSGPDTWQGRLKWLQRQYTNFSDDKALRAEYKADTYTTLYQVLKNNGLMKEANDVLMEKIRIEGRLRGAPLSVINLIYEVICGFGLRPGRAIVWYVVYSLFVSVFVAQANGVLGDIAFSRTSWNWVNATERGVEFLSEYLGHGVAIGLAGVGVRPNVLVVQGAPVNRFRAEVHTPSGAEDYFEVDPPVNARQAAEIPCGDRISAGLYALDMIVPAIEFNQTNKCDFSGRAGLFWLTFKALATLFGWFLTSITALTLSGIVRRQIEPR
ncbi:hypothetical protein ABENE_13660 [Asticcacaulis benevestitus DSM 16100 = ATCC BAA-896]|uniref:Membrane-associated oxidoreductase n=2 Tax=Asticcacaulis TaxID=76890 RepID=V4PR38_9CAUL|nr:hypothetical protein ABENE_13660 [Asticcacaulis benevestitus DSM 16100 = ATCC BAA-896]